MADRKKIAIVGGGFLGLSLAYQLAKTDKFEITLIEKLSEWGGLASGLKINDTYIEKYYHHWFKSDEDIQNLIHELGLNDKLIWPESTSGVFYQGRLINFSTSLDLLKFPVLNIWQRIRLGVVSLFLQKTKDYQKFEKISALSWCNRYFGSKVTKVLWEPLLKSKFGKHFDQIAMSWLWARIYDRSSSRPGIFSKERLGYLNGGFQILIDSLVIKLKSHGVELLNQTSIKNYQYQGTEHLLALQSTNGEETLNTYDIVVSTLPGPAFTQIFKPDAKLSAKISQVKYLGAICMIIQSEQSVSPYYWLSVVDDQAPLLAVIEHTNLHDKNKYGGKHILYLAKYLSPDDPLFSKNEAEITEIFLNYLQKINPGFKLNWVSEKHLFKAAFAQHIVSTNYQVVDYTTDRNGLYYANFSQIYPHDRGTNYAVAQAKQLAKIINDKY